MEIVEQHIRQLLHDEKRLIIPRMGCFVIAGKPEVTRAKEQAEQVSEAGIEFHAALQHNDGVLAERIAESEKVSYDDAMNSIEGFVREVRSSLEKEGAYLIDQVGAFYLDQHQNIRFNPWESETSQTGFHVTGETTFLHKRTAPNLLSRFALLAVLSLVGWLHFSATYQRYLRLSYTVDDGRSTEQLPIVRSTTTTASPVIQPNIAQAVEPVTEKETAADAVPSLKKAAPAISPAAYYVVAGTFKSKDNAGRKLRELKDQGFTDATTYIDERGFHMVAYGSRGSRSSAAGLLDELRQRGLDARVVRH